MEQDDKAKLYYASWWRRICAHLIDGVIVLLPGIVQIHIGETSPRLLPIVVVPFSIIWIGYFIYCHKRWGKTVGKLALGIRVVGLDGSHLSWRQAVLRNIGEIAFTIPYLWVFINAYSTVPLAEYMSTPTANRFNMIKTLWPSWYPTVSTLNQCWMWSEFVVMLFNQRRRALHDFIAGTVVVQKMPTLKQARSENPYDIDFSKEMKRLGKL